MDTQKTVRKYLWYDLIANLSFGLVAMAVILKASQKALISRLIMFL